MFLSGIHIFAPDKHTLGKPYLGLVMMETATPLSR